MEYWKDKKYNKCSFVLIIAMYFNISSWTCFVFKVHPAFADRLHDISDNTLSSKRNDLHNGTVPQYHRKQFIGTPSTEFSSTNQLSANHDQMFRYRSDICIQIWRQNASSIQYNSNPTWSGDTTGQDDIVRKQYSSLPYPAVGKTDLTNEQNYYNNGSLRNIPYAIYSPIALEYINHFLYNGANDFM